MATQKPIGNEASRALHCYAPDTWRFEEGDTHHEVFAKLTGGLIATVPVDAGDVVPSMMNAAAIAAVPDLINACGEVLDYLESRSDGESNMLWGKVSAAVRAAIGA